MAVTERSYHHGDLNQTLRMSAADLIAARPRATRAFGGYPTFFTAFVVEVALSIAYAPVMMIQQTKAVLRAIFTRSEPWTPQQRSARGYPLLTVVKFHWMETLFGLLLLAGLIAGLVSLWLLPIMASLVLAVPLSALSGVTGTDRLPQGFRMASPHTLREPAIVAQARQARMQIKSQLDAAEVAAE